MTDSIASMVIAAAAETAEHQAGLVVIRALSALAARAEANGTAFVTVYDVLAVAVELGQQLDKKIAERLAEHENAKEASP